MATTQITTVTEVARDGVVGARVDGVDLVAVAGPDGIRVYEGHCPHQGTLLSEGHVEMGRLVCRGHGWQFDCGSGQKVDDACFQPRASSGAATASWRRALLM